MLGIPNSHATPSLKRTMQVTAPMNVSAAVEVTMGCRFILLAWRQRRSWFEKCMVACVTEWHLVCDNVDLALHPAVLLST